MTSPRLSRMLLFSAILFAILAIDARILGGQTLVAESIAPHQWVAAVEAMSQATRPMGISDEYAGVLMLLVLAAVLILIEWFVKKALYRNSTPRRQRNCQLTHRMGRFIKAGAVDSFDDDTGHGGNMESSDPLDAAIRETRRLSLAGKTVMIADDDLEITQMLVLRFKHLGMVPSRTPHAIQILLGAHQTKPDLVILDVNMPTGNGLAVCEMLASAEGLERLPVIVYTGCSSEQTARRCAELGAHYVLKGPHSWKVIEQIVCGLFCPGEHIPSPKRSYKPSKVSKSSVDISATLKTEPVVNAGSRQHSASIVPRHDIGQQLVVHDGPCPIEAIEPAIDSCDDQQTPRPKVLIIDDDHEISAALSLRLNTFGVDVVPAFSGMDGYWRAMVMRPDLILCDMNMPDGDGNYILGRLQMHSLTKDIPVIFITGQTDPSLRRTMMTKGAAGYFKKPLNTKLLIDEMRRHITLPDEPQPATTRLATADPLPIVTCPERSTLTGLRSSTGKQSVPGHRS